jgi:hypothetical protein
MSMPVRLSAGPFAFVLFACGCGGARSGGAALGTDAGTGSEAATGGDDGGTPAESGSPEASTTRTLTAFTTANGTTVPTGFGTATGTCAQLTRDTSSCQAARTALGLSGNWLSFSCNVVEGLATSSQAATTSLASATYVSLTTSNLPDFASKYYPTTGSYDFTANGYTVTGTFDSLYSAFTTAFPDPNSTAAQTVTMYVPLSPAAAAAESQTMNGMNGGAEGLAIDGVVIFDSAAGGTDNIFAEAGSFDECGGHPDQSGTYHYHAEPYSISYDDDHLIGVMRDGFFLYGRRDADGSTPGSLAVQQAAGAGTSNLVYVYGGHTGTAPVATDTGAFHYHATEWKGCYDETGGGSGPGSKVADDGSSYDSSGTFDTPATTTCGGSWVDGWFLTGHGNGGAFAMVPTGLAGQSPSQTTAAVRYFYGTPGPCTHCGGI